MSGKKCSHVVLLKQNKKNLSLCLHVDMRKLWSGTKTTEMSQAFDKLL